MKFFTADWYSGTLSDEAFDAAIMGYQRHIEALLPSLPSSLHHLVTNLSLHDGIIEEIAISATELSMAMRIGDLQRGYSTLSLIYGGFEYNAATVTTLQKVRLSRAELRSDELDCMSSSFEHRLFYSPTLQLSIIFQSLYLTQTLRPDRTIAIPNSHND